MSLDVEVFDHIVVGAGTAGCVIAARLAEDPSVNVALVEAGSPDTHPLIHVPVGMVGLINHPKLNWGYVSEPQAALGGRSIPVPRGRMLGGSGGLNGMVYTRGHRRDYDDWQAAGATGWGYDDVLPYFRRSQDCPDFAGDFHGTGGPVRVSGVAAPNVLTRAFLAAAQSQGFSANADINGPEQDGFGLRQVTIRNGRRETSATAFLRARRSNLKVISGALVDRVEIREGRAVGVVLRLDGVEARIQARGEVILSAGVFGSPAILMRSGLGPAAHLAELGIEVVRDAPEVGQNLADHPSAQTVWSERGSQSYGISAQALPRLALTVFDYLLRRKGMLASNIFEAAGYVRSAPDLDRPDVQIVFCPASRKPGGTLGVGHGFALGVVGLHPRSTGRVRLASSRAEAPPRIDLGLLTDERDVDTMLRGLSIARRIATDPALARHGQEELVPGREVAGEEQARAFLRASVATAFHPVGTCRMGSDDRSVVDPELRVRGIAGLRVADAAIMPAIVGGNTNAPTMMIAEKAADLIRGRTIASGVGAVAP